MNSLTMLNGISPILASAKIKLLFDPKQYGVFDVKVWRALLKRTTKPFHDPKLPEAFGCSAKNREQTQLEVEKALFKKSSTNPCDFEK